MNVPQIDEYVPNRFLRWIGATRELLGRARFWIGYPQFLMIAVLFYYESNLIQGLFPTVWIWMLFLAFVGFGTVVFEYMVVFPSHITFNAGQNARENRNPIYRQVRENERKLNRIMEELEDDD